MGARLVTCVLAAMLVERATASGYTWSCVNATVVNGTWIDYDGSGSPSVGDCLQLPSGEASKLDYTSNTTSASALPGTEPMQFATWAPNATCGGYTITSISGNLTVGTSGTSLAPPANLTCAEGQVPLATYNNPPSRIITTTGRGVGVPVSSCQQHGADWEEDAGLCYPPCNAGYSGNGPLCLTDCPVNFPDQGLECGKPSSYGRGAGSIWGGAGKVKWGGLYYPACAANFHNVGCCVCSPDCPAGTTDIGVSCQKGSYGRGVGQPLGCAAGQQYDAGLCYNQCPAGASGSGPLCYGACTADDPFRLGIWCFNSESERNEILGAIIGGVIAGAILAVAAAIVAPVTIAAASAATVALPVYAGTGPINSSLILIGISAM
jgi:hypothetical protein